MKKALILIALFTVGIGTIYAQSALERLGKRVVKRAGEQVEQRIEQKAEEGVEKAMDKAEEATRKKNSDKTSAESKSEKSEKNSDISSSSASGEQQKVDVSYLKYDFTPGNEIIFEDDLKGEQKGEFPSKWDLIEGNAEIAVLKGENVLALVGYTYITPLFKDKSYKFPAEFTLEFDLFLDGNEGETSVEFLNESEDVVASSVFWKDNTRFLFNWNLTQTQRTSEESFVNKNGWHHYALSFNKRAMKIYMDSKRVANVPNITDNITRVKFFARGPEDNSAFHIKNIRIAQGAVPLYDKFLTDGKIVTYGITFDVAKATIKPESMGTINEILTILKNSPTLKFSIEGHTDNTGSSELNQNLSEARAKAVQEQLIQMGIAPDRLSFKGLGMTKPIDSNDTTEGRAKNRRVEFVKM